MLPVNVKLPVAAVNNSCVVNSADPSGLPLLLVLLPSSQISQTLYAVPADSPDSVIPTLWSLPLPLVGTPVVVLPLAVYPVELKPCLPLPMSARAQVGVFALVNAAK